MMKVKDYFKIALWSLLYVAIVFAAMFLGILHPFWWVYSAIPIAVLGAWPYMRLTRSYPFFGMALLPALLLIIISIAIGEGNWLFVSLAAAVTVITETIRKTVGGYGSKQSMQSSYLVFALLPFSASLCMWIWPETSMEATVEEMGADYASRMATVTAPWLLFVGIAATLCLAWISIRIVDKDSYLYFFDNARKPKNTWLGRLMISGMNVAHAKVADWGMNFLQLKDEKAILDIGCGGGRNIHRMAEKLPEAKLYGIDYSAASIEKSRLNNRKAVREGRVFFTEGNAQDLPYEDCMFDVVTAFETVYFWPEVTECFRGVHRVLRKGGRFMVVCELNDPSQGVKWEKMVGGMTTYTARKIRQMMLEAGFAKAECHEQGTWMTIIGTK